MDRILPAARRFVFDTLFMRCFSFILNQLIVRFANPVTIGVAAIQLELLLSSLLFLSREAIRLALLRANLQQDKLRFRQFINISWIPAVFLFLVLIISLISQATWSTTVPPHIIQLYVLGALLEVAGEPFYNFYNNRVVLRPRVLAESMAVTMRSLSTCILVVYFKFEVLGFGIAQVCYGIVYVITLLICSVWVTDSNNAHVPLHDFLPAYLQYPPLSADGKQNKSAMYDIIAYQFGPDNMQNVYATGPFFLFKHILTEGDKIIMSSLRSNYHQGIYAILNNYVSLVARLVFYPIEESSRIAFAQMTQKIKHEKTAAEAKQALMSQCRLLYRLILVFSIFGISFPLFGCHYARLLVNLFLSPQWRSEATVTTLIAFCPYICVLGVNGITEAYVHTVTPSSYFGNVNSNLFNSFVVFAIIAIPLIAYLGTCGVVIANTVSMVVRIILNYQIIIQSFGNPSVMFGRPMDALDGIKVHRVFVGFYLPRIEEYSLPSTLYSVLMFCFGIAFASSSRYAHGDMSIQHSMEHLCIGIFCFLYFLFSVYQCYESELEVILRNFVSKKASTVHNNAQQLQHSSS